MRREPTWRDRLAVQSAELDRRRGTVRVTDLMRAPVFGTLDRFDHRGHGFAA